MIGSLKDKLAAVVSDSQAVKEKICSTAKDTFQETKASISDNTDKIFDAITDAISNNWNSISHFIVERTGNSVLSAVQDDDFMAMLASLIYPWLPPWIRIFLKEEAFTTFVLANRTFILNKIQNRLLQDGSGPSTLPREEAVQLLESPQIPCT